MASSSTNISRRSFRNYEPFVADGVVELDRDEIRVTWLGRIFIRNVAMAFDTYLERQKMDSKPLFSKTL